MTYFKQMSKIFSFIGLFLLLTGSLFSQTEVVPVLQKFQDDSSGLWGFKNTQGIVVIEPQFYFASDFTGSIAAVADKDGWHYIDLQGKVLEIRPFVIDNGPDYFREGMVRFIRDGKIGFLNQRGQIVIKARFRFVTPFFDGLAAFCSDCQLKKQGEHTAPSAGKWGFINQKGEVVIPPKFDGIKHLFLQGRAVVRINDRWVTIDKNGQIIE